MTLNRVLGPTSQVEIKDVLDRTKDEVYYNFNCVQVGSVVSYDPSKNTASVQIGMKRQLPTEQIIDYPVLEDCPVMFLFGGQSFISLPIAAGDTCIILFNDRDIDTWWYSGESNVPPSGRAHSLSDALVLVGIKNQTNKIALSTSAITLNGANKKITIKNSSQSLKPLLDELFDELTQSLISWLQTSLLTTLQGLQVQMGSTPLPLTPASIAALTALSPALTTLTTNMNLTKNKLGQLLDEGD